MSPDLKVPNEAQRKKLCEMLHLALVDLRLLSGTGKIEQAHDLADTFHNLPQEMWQDYFSISFFREAFLAPYAAKWGDVNSRLYLSMLEEVKNLEG